MKAMTMKPAQVQSLLCEEVAAVLAARAAHQVEAERAAERYGAILASGDYRDDEGSRVTDPKHAYRIADESQAKAYYAFCDEANRKAGSTLPEGHCPALVAECEVTRAERALIDKAGPLFGDMTAEKLLNAGLAKYKQFVELAIGLVLAKPKESPMRLKTITAYLTMRELDESPHPWFRLLIRNQLAAEGRLGEVLKVARARLGVVTVEVWDELRGEFTSEVVTDERV